MRKFYSLVLMATALLFGTNVWAADVAKIGTKTYTSIAAAINDAADGSTIIMTSNASITASIPIGKDGTSKNITFDFNGKTVSSSKNYPFALYKGTLRLINSVPGVGGLTATNTYGIGVYGTYLKGVNSRTAAENELFAHLIIEKGVNINATKEAGGTGIIVLPCRATGSTDNKGAMIYYDSYNEETKKWDGNPRGVANGVRIDIKGDVYGSKYAVQTNGQLAGPIAEKYGEYYNLHKTDFYSEGYEYLELSIGDTAYTPYIHVYEGAKLTAADNSSSAVAAYASGYARWYIEGECAGATGLYMKSGIISLDDAVITSTYENDATIATGKIKGVTAAGNAVVVESNAHYTGNCELNINGDTKVSTEANNGTALMEVIAAGTQSSVEAIEINGGTLTGDNAIVISDQTAEENVVTVYGGNIDGAVAAGTGDLGDLLPKSGDYHTTDVIVDGKTTVVVSAGTGPAASNTVIGATELTAVKWNGTTPETLTGSKTLTELEINENFAQTLNIADGAKLIVGRLILGDNAKVVVKAGGKLIITGAQGVNASKVSNIVLESSQEKQAVLLFSPDVNTNRYPKATVNMYVAKGKNGSDDVWTRFGMPIKSLDAMKRANAYTTWIYEWDYVANAGQGDWALVANVSTDMEAWKGYTLSYDNEGEQTYTFEGSLVGNGDAPVNFVHRGYNYFGNSYTSYVDAKTLVESLPDAIDETVYMWDVENQNYASATMNNLVNNPERLDAAWQKDIAPMTTFILRLMDQDNASTNIDYASAIWSNPRHGNAGSGAAAPAMHAPARIASDETFIKMVVTAANGMSDRINLTEGSEYTDAYERGYDAAKYMNEKSINLYASIDGENYGDVASNTLVGKTISLQTVNDVNYIISFKHADANEYAILDKVTGQKVDIEEGATYEFTAQPNSKIEERFEIVERQYIPTAIENTEVKANAKGIYSITGLYLGEDFNALPAGVYVVNGVKVVK